MLPLLLSIAMAEDLPPAPVPPPTPSPYESDAAPAFGTDASIGYLAGSLLGSWPQPGVHGAITGRYDAFVVPRTRGGPRLGASLWGARNLWPTQRGLDDPEAGGESVDVRYDQVGLMAIIRYDPADPVSALAGLGFGRLLLYDYDGGVLVLPMLSFEGGARTRLGPHTFADWTVRAHEATSRSVTDPTVLHEWWMVQGGVSLGVHLR